MKNPTKCIRAAGEQYHCQTAIEKFGANAVVAERTSQLSQKSPGVSPLLCQIQALAELGLSQEIDEGETPYKDVHKTLQARHRQALARQASQDAAKRGQALRESCSKAMVVLCNDSGNPVLAG